MPPYLEKGYPWSGNTLRFSITIETSFFKAKMLYRPTNAPIGEYADRTNDYEWKSSDRRRRRPAVYEFFAARSMRRSLKDRRFGFLFSTLSTNCRIS